VEKSSTEITINPVSCIGCGICVPKCSPQAIKLNHCTNEQLLAQIRGVCKGGHPPKILAFVEKETAYGSADLAGQNRQSYSTNVEIIGVPSTGRVGLVHVLQAFASGADGIVFVEDHGGVFKEDALRSHVIQLKKELREYGIESLRFVSISTTLPEYHKVLNIFDTLASRLAKMGPILNEKRAKIQNKIASPYQT
jgi:heterodisulfide reductase subunit A